MKEPFKARIKKGLLLGTLLIACYLWLVFNLFKKTGKIEFNVFRSEALVEFLIFSGVVIAAYFVYQESKKR